MKKIIKTTIATTIGAMIFTVSPASATQYFSRANFTATLGASFTDTFDGYTNAGFASLTNAQMSAVKGQTKFTSTAFQDNNLLFDQSNYKYCAGCNGSFTLDFTGTSYGTSAGVFGVGVDITGGEYAFLTFGNGTTQNISLTGQSFFGYTSASAIKSIAFGGLNGASSFNSQYIDNLTIGSSGAVPEPATWAMMILGMGMVGFAMRRRNKNVTTTVAYTA